MADVQHASLTGASLHEPKGVAAADANRVYVSDGAGSGDWSTVSLDVLANPAKAFEAQLLHVRDEKSSGTAGGSFTSGDWRTRVLNTIKTNEISGASVTSNQITLPAGTYFICATAPSDATNRNTAKLRNITDGTNTLIGTAVFSPSVGSNNASVVKGRFTIASEKVFELQHRAQTTGIFGLASSLGVVEVYAEVLIWKIA